MTDGQNSILGKIISIKQADEALQFDPKEVINSLFKESSSREQEVLRRRFGLDGKKAETLEKIGESFKITRERIRQLERESIKRIRQRKNFDKLIQPVENVINQILEESGGILEENFLMEKLLAFAGDTVASRSCLNFILSYLLPGKFQRVEPNDDFKAGWRLNPVSLAFIGKILGEFLNIVKAVGKPQRQDDLFAKFKESQFYQQNKESLADKDLVSFLRASARMGQNIFDEWGLSDWPSIMPKRMRDKAYLIMKRENKPVHFTKIAELINETRFDKKIAYPATIHNELILDKRFVLVGRGIYALIEWGYKPGIVADVVADVLKQAGRPMTKDEIVAEVLKQRVVGKSTIHLALANKERFRKLSDNKFELIIQTSITEKQT